MEFDKVEFMWKDSNSNTGDCPALSRVDGGYLVTGKVVGDDTRAKVAQFAGVSGDETVVFVPDNILDRLRGVT